MEPAKPSFLSIKKMFYYPGSFSTSTNEFVLFSEMFGVAYVGLSEGREHFGKDKESRGSFCIPKTRSDLQGGRRWRTEISFKIRRIVKANGSLIQRRFKYVHKMNPTKQKKKNPVA